MKPKYATLKANCYLSNELNANYVDKKRLYGEIGDDKIAGYGGGHIDLIETVDTVQVCNSACYFSSQEVWFWPLD